MLLDCGLTVTISYSMFSVLEMNQVFLAVSMMWQDFVTLTTPLELFALIVSKKESMK